MGACGSRKLPDMASIIMLSAFLVVSGASEAAQRPAAEQRLLRLAAATPCDGEVQMVMCGAIPFEAVAQRMACCAMWEAGRGVGAGAGPAGAAPGPGGFPAAAPLPLPLPPEVQEQFAGLASLAAEGIRAAYAAANCTASAAAIVPDFRRGVAATAAELNTMVQEVPLPSAEAARRVQAAALAVLPAEVAERARAIWEFNRASRASSAFVHPGGPAGAAELALMQARLAEGSPLHSAALVSLLTGAGVPPKVLEPTTGWSPPVDTQPDGCGGPYAMATTAIQYGGVERSTAACPASYPPAAPLALCGHVSFVELDAAAAYRHAVAAWATGDARHARAALRAVDAWSTTNQQFGLAEMNAALESAWGAASMARAMELLRSHPGWGTDFGSDDALQRFVAWASGTLLPLMDGWVRSKEPPPSLGGDGNVYANWHASIAEAWTVLGVLSDDAPRFRAGVALARKTVESYLKWGRGRWADGGRVVGECTESMRDVYHSLFGIGSLLQAAEVAWQQGDGSVYAAGGHALAAAMELHAAIVNAGRDESRLPPGYRLYESMPPPPSGCSWRVNLGSQRWEAVNRTSGRVVSELRDGVRYVIGSKYLPTGWTYGLNHYGGRLGLSMPQTAALLQANPVEFYEMAWGLGTLTHTGSAEALWRPGLRAEVLCGGGGGGGSGGGGGAQ